jgi:pre-mRNA-processing factor 6
VKLNSDWGDTWAWFYKFEVEHGTEEHQEDVIKRCVTADPHHGPAWTSVAKDARNWRKSTKEVLLLTAAAQQQ